jgi:hypothetical protein
MCLKLAFRVARSWSMRRHCSLRLVVVRAAWQAAAAGVAICTAWATLSAADAAAATSAVRRVPVAAAAAAGWRQIYSSAAGVPGLLSVVAPSGRDAWAMGGTRSGTGTLFLHWNGIRWRLAQVAGAGGFVGATEAAASSDRNVWVFGVQRNSYGVRALRFDGTAWHRVGMPHDVLGGTPVVLSRSDVWFNGGFSCVTVAGHRSRCRTKVWHWDGLNWSAQVFRTMVVDMAGSSSGHVWLIGLNSIRGMPSGRATGRPVLYRWNGSTWVHIFVPNPRVRGVPAIAASSNTDLWLEQSPVLASARKDELVHWNGVKWKDVPVPAGMPTGSPPVPDRRGGVWLGPWAHWTGRKWVNASIFNGLEIDAITTAGRSASVWGVGWRGSFARGRRIIAIYGPLP